MLIVVLTLAVGPQGIVPRVLFHNHSPSLAIVSGWVVWFAAVPPNNVVQYKVYAGASPSDPIGSPIATLLHQQDKLNYRTRVNMTRPANMFYILVYTASYVEENPFPSFVKIIGLCGFFFVNCDLHPISFDV